MQVRRAETLWLLIGTAIAMYVFVMQLMIYYVPAYSAGSDESAYFLTAKSIAQRGESSFRCDNPLLFVSECMVEVRPGVFEQKYPIGFPLLLAAGYKLGGITGAFLVNPLFGCLCIVGTVLLARELAGRWAVLVAMLLAIHPLLLFQSVGGLSHVSDTACIVWGMWCLWRWGRFGGMRWAIPAGLLLGYAACIRYTEAMLGLVMVFVALCRARQPAATVPAIGSPDRSQQAFPGTGFTRAWWLEVAAMAGAASLALAPLIVFQWRAFGSPFTTGYSFCGESAAFSARWFLEHARPLFMGLNASGFGLCGAFPLAAAGLLVWAIAWIAGRSGARGSAHQVGFLLLWIVPSLLLYCAYYWISPEPQLYLRLLLGIYPGILIAAVLVLKSLATRRRWLAGLMAAVLCALAVAGRMYPTTEFALRRDRMMADMVREAATLIPETTRPDSLVIADYWLAYYFRFATNCDVIYPSYVDASWVAKRAANAALPGQWDFNKLRAQRFFDRFGGRTQEQLNAILRQEITQRLDRGQDVFLLTADMEDPAAATAFSLWSKRLGDRLHLTRLDSSPRQWMLYRVELSRSAGGQ